MGRSANRIGKATAYNLTKQLRQLIVTANGFFACAPALFFLVLEITETKRIGLLLTQLFFKPSGDMARHWGLNHGY